MKPETENYGVWQAYVGSGRTKEIQLERFAEAPKRMQKRIQSHMRTMIALREIIHS